MHFLTASSGVWHTYSHLPYSSLLPSCLCLAPGSPGLLFSWAHVELLPPALLTLLSHDPLSSFMTYRHTHIHSAHKPQSQAHTSVYSFSIDKIKTAVFVSVTYFV